jgi:putative peptidoglycan lipid II flippase
MTPRAAPDTRRILARSTGALAAATGVSRVLGFIRDLLIAERFGTLAQAQAFVVAFRLPNLIRDLVAEGAVTSAFVPVLSRYRATQPPEELWRLSQALGTRVAVAVCAVGLAGVLAAPLLVRLIAPGFAAEPEKLALTVTLTRVLFPLISLVGLWAYFMGLLNSLRHFAVPALGPAILNLAMIGGCLWVVPRITPGALGLALAVLAGGLLQLAVQVPVALRLGFRWRWRWRHPGSRDILRLLGPRTAGAAVYQASVILHTALASLSAVVGEGAVAALYYANRLVQLPLALFGTASAQASLPMLSEQAAHQRWGEFRDTLLAVIRMVAFVVLPSSVGLMVLAFPIVGGLFERGAFDHGATVMTAQALIWYAPGLLAYALSKVLSGAFYALHDTRTPVRLAVEAVAANLALSLLLMGPLRVSGLACAAAVSSALNACRLLQRLEARLGEPLLRPLAGPALRMLLASCAMGLGCWAAWQAAAFDRHPLLGLPVVIALGLMLYPAACAALGVRELATAWRGVQRWRR